MKHARKKTSTKTTSKKTRLTSEKTRTPKTDADYKKKYLYDDNYAEFSKKISSAGYKTRHLDSYIPREKLQSKVKASKKNIDETRRINTKEAQILADAKKKSSKNKKSTAKKKPSKVAALKNNKPLLRKVMAYSIISFLSAVIVLLGIGAGMYSAVSNELEDMNVSNLALNYSSFVYYNDDDGNAKELVQLHYEGERRVWVDSDEISKHLKDAAVAIEDERFYKHNGVDLRRTAGATIGWALEKIGIGDASYGGSTLTQQLIKNITNEKDKSAMRKIKEMMRAVAIEKQINDKDAILTMYLNISFFANQCNGVEAAANLYFDKSAKDVTIAEAATIVGITQRPSYYDPIKNPENALKKRNVVLAKMNELGYISDEEYETAKNSDLGLNKNVQRAKKNVYSYFVDQVINDVINDLIQQKGYSATFAEQQTFSGGLKIYTTMSKDVQDAMDEVFENKSGFPSSKNIQGAMVVVDQYTGEIKGMVGGAGQKTDSRGLNRATQTKRQPGSSIKPLSVYAPGIENGNFNAATILKDEKFTIGDWNPVNSYSGFKGNMTLRRAIEISANIPAIKSLQMFGINNSYNFLKNKLSMDSIVPNDKNLASLALGGLTDGVTVKEMAGAYGAIANGGTYIEPFTYTKVVDSTGKILLEHESEPKRVLSKATAFIVTDMLYGVVNSSGGTGRAAKLPTMPCYGKTGTTNDVRDKWFIGFTKHYTGAVWVGFDQPSNLQKAGIYNNPSCVIWKNVMAKINDGLDTSKYQAPDSVKTALICTKTGKFASSGCSFAKTEYFVSGSLPTRYCSLSHGDSAPKNPDDEEDKKDPQTETGDENNGEGTDTPLASDTQNNTENSQGAQTTTPPENNTQPPETDEPIISLD